MNKVLTVKDYEEKQRIQSKPCIAEGGDDKPIDDNNSVIPSLQPSTTEYTLMHPDFPSVSEGEFKVKDVVFKIESGLIRTLDKDQRTALQDSGFIFLYQKELKGEADGKQ